MKIYYDRGIIVEVDGNRLYLDPELSSTPIKHPTLVTHAHSDHTAAISGAATSFLTQTTLDLYEASSKRNPRNYKIIEFNEPFEIGEFEIEYRNAGHLLGAAQILVRTHGSSFLYTGDFCPEDLLTVPGADIPREEIDLAVMDATYGDRRISFESRQVSRQNLFFWVISQLNTGKVPMINIGHLGGAQEVIKFFNKLSPTLPIIVSEKVNQICTIFERHGVELTYRTFSDPEIRSILADKCLVLMPRSFKNEEGLLKKYPVLEGRLSKAIVTGQTAKYGFSRFHFASALSTHAHYDELIETTKQLDPKFILTHYGHHKKFANSLVHDYHFSAASFSNSKPIETEELKKHEPRSSQASTVKLSKKENIFDHTPLSEFF